MARPIEATPPVEGEDAERIQESLRRVPPPEEVERRRAASRVFLEEASRPKGPRATGSEDADARVIDALRAAARRRDDEDPRWRALADETLPADEIEALREEAAGSEEGRALWELYRPFDEEEKARIFDGVTQRMRAERAERSQRWRSRVRGAVLVVVDALRGALRGARASLEERRGRRPDDGHRDVVIETYGTWPSPEEMELRTVVEQAVAASGVADVLGADAGRGSVSLWVRLKRRDDA